MKKILIKVSGDLSNHKKFLRFARLKTSEGKVVVICGAGTKINKRFKKEGFDIKFDRHGRVLQSLREHQIVKKVLIEEKQKLKERLRDEKISVKIPLINLDEIECHVNADKLVRTYYLGFDEIYVFTLKDRMNKKDEYFKNYEKVEVIGI